MSEDGAPTAQFEDFRQARSDDEYRTRLQEWLRATYADVLQYVDPTTDGPARIADAFRTYVPAGQRPAMASLFVGLWKYAGLEVAEADSRASTPPSRAPRRVTATPPGSRSRRKAPQAPPAHTSVTDGLPPGLIGLLQQIPRDGASWTSTRRDDFLHAFGAVLDFSVPVDDSPPAEDTDDAEVNTS